MAFKVVNLHFHSIRMCYHGNKFSNSVVSAIPMEWKTFFTSVDRGMFIPLCPHKYDQVMDSKGKGLSRSVYKFVSEDVMMIHNKFVAWNREIGSSVCEGLYDFGKLHREIYGITNVAKYRSFQYRLLQRALTTNIQLYKWGISETELCYYCNTERETISHLLYWCPKVMAFWLEVISYVKDRFNVQIDLSIGSIITNRIYSKRGKVINFIVLLAKQFIYKQKCMKSNLNMWAFKRVLCHVESVEKYIAIKIKGTKNTVRSGNL